MQTASRPSPRLQHRPVAYCFLLLLFALAPAARLLAQAGTADGTYNFAGVGSANSGGTDFKIQGDKFLVSNIFQNDNNAPSIMFAANDAQGVEQSAILKANNTVVKTFTLKDLSVSNFGSTTFALSKFTITLKDMAGNTIATHALAAQQSFTNAGPSIASFNFTTPWPAAGYNLVNSVEITYQYAGPTVRPSNMNWNNWTLTNLSNTAQTSLTVGNISGSPFCAGSSVSVPFTSSGMNSGNVYTAQLSNSSGSFTSPVTLGTLTSNATSGSISGIIPTGTAGGSGYRIRVVSSNPGATTADNGTNLTINAAPTVNVVQNQTICNGGATTAVSFSGTGSTFNWTNDNTSIGIGSSGTGNLPAFLPANTGSTTQVANITVTPVLNGCSGTPRTFSYTVYAAITATTVVTNVACFGGSTGAIDLTPGGGSGSGYSYLWSNGTSTQDRSNLAAGTYAVSITDGANCTKTFNNIVVGQPSAPVSGTTVVTNVACFGGTTGAINLTPAGGTPGYTYLWNNGSTTTEDRTGLSAGTYSVVITDANNCQATVSNITVSQPTSAVSGTTVVTNVACFGGTNGAINLTPAGGAGGYTFLWNNGTTTTEDRTGLPAGTYSVIITDNNGCTGTVSNISVVQPTAPVSGTTVVTNVSCFGGSNGAINLTPTGGTPGGYTFNWGSGITTEDRTGLPGGNYSVVITDINGCTGTVSNISVGQPSAGVSGTTVVTNVACFGGSNGAINLTPTGGTPGGYTYNWGGGITTEDRTGLSAGNYAVIITDINGCTGTINPITVGQPTAPVSGTTVVTNVACFGGTTGAINLTPAGGAGGYTYNWGGGITTEDRTNLSAGAYSVIITDANGCTGTVSNISVGQPSAPVSASTVVTNVSCNGGSNGAINLTPAGGNSPYTFNWGGGITTEDRTGLAAGNYSVTITDNNGCTGTVSNISITEPAAVSATIAYTGSPYFTGTGTATVTRTGTTGGAYTSTTGLTLDASNGAIDLAASTPGTYTVTYTIANATCGDLTTTASVTLVSPFSAIISYDGSPYCDTTGMATVTLTGTPGGTFSSTAGLAIDAQTGAIDLAASTPGTYTVRYGTTPTDFATTRVAVRPATFINPVPNQVVCAGASLAPIDFTGVPGIGYAWTVENPAIGLPASGTQTLPGFTAQNSGTTLLQSAISVLPTGGTGCTGKAKAMVFHISVNPMPTVDAVSNQTLCAGSATGAIAFTGNVPGTTYSWTNTNTAIGLNAIGTGDIASFTARNNTASVQTSTVTVTPYLRACAGTPTSFTLTVAPGAGMLTYTGSPYCPAGAAAPMHQGTTGGTYTATPGLVINPQTGIVNLALSQTGTYTVTYTVATALSGCSNTATAQLTILPQATINAVPNQVYCQGTTTAPVAFGGTATSYSWTSDNNSIGLAPSGTGMSLPSFTTVNAGPATQYATIRVTPQGDGSTNCTGKTIAFRIVVNYCPPVTQAASTVGTDANARTASMGAAFQVGPNPARSKAVLTYLGREAGAFTVQLLNGYGTPIGTTGTFTGSTYTLDLTGVTPGVYLVQITDAKTGNSCVKQLVKL